MDSELVTEEPRGGEGGRVVFTIASKEGGTADMGRGSTQVSQVRPNGVKGVNSVNHDNFYLNL